MNKVIMLGRFTKDPEVRYTNGEHATAIASFSLAVDRRFKRQNEPDADFFNCTAFGKQAEFIEKYMKKGMKVLVAGRVENNNYTDRNGQKVYATRIAIEEIEFAESKNSSQSQTQNQAQQSGGFMDVDSFEQDELPFN